MIHGTWAPRPHAGPSRAAPRRHRARPGLAVALLAVFGVLVALVPAGPAAAEPAPSTLTLSASGGSRQYETTTVAVNVTSAGTPSGVVVFTEGATAIGQATLQPNWIGWTASMPIAFDTVGPHTITASYAGTTTVAPSTSSITITVVTHTPYRSVTGSITTGSLVTPFGAGQGFTTSFYDPVTGYLSVSQSEAAPQVFTRDVPGIGVVTVTGRPSWFSYVSTGGYIAADGTVSAVRFQTYIDIDRVTVAGVTWAAGYNCRTGVAMNLTGSLEPTGLHLTGSTLARFSKIAPVDPTLCAGFATSVDEVLAGSASTDLLVSGSFPVPPPDNTSTTTVVAVDGAPFTAGDQALVHATVTAAFPVTPIGTVTFDRDGVRVASAELVGGVAQATVDLDTAGPASITATYLGVNGRRGPILVTSTGSTTVDVADGPPGRPATGQVVTGTNAPIVFATGTRLTGATFDPSTGAIGPGSFWIPVAQSALTIEGFDVNVRYQLSQVGPMTGQVARDGTVTFSPATFRFEGRAYNFGAGQLSSLGTCTFEPIIASLHGTADASGLHLTATGAQIPPVASTDCAGFGSSVNSSIAGGASFTFDVTGDFQRDASPTPVSIVSWFPSVALHNQTYLTARVTSSPNAPATGDVTFRDGPTVLGVAPIDTTGLATLVTEMDQAGTRTITADYTGDPIHEPGTATTTIDVTPAPAGYALDGTVAVAGASFTIGAGSTLVPATAPGAPPTTPTARRAAIASGLGSSTAALWFMPTTIPLDLPGYGPVQAEVRLVQSGPMTAATLGTGGSIDGLGGTFVLQVRKVTTTTGTVRPLGCVNLVLLAFDGHLTFTGVDLTTTHGGTGRIPWGTCTGIGQAVIDQLAGTTHATIHATL